MCAKCQSTKSVHKKKFGFDRHLPIPSGPFESVLMHLMTCFAKWEGTNAIFVLANMFSKLTNFAPIQTNTIATRTTKLFFNMWI
jgi:hypothetical protein